MRGTSPYVRKSGDRPPANSPFVARVVIDHKLTQLMEARVQLATG